MKQIQQRQLTENELILELEKERIVGITKRTVGDWRREGLLPDFDISGRGLGKGLGRTESAWEHADLIIERARWLYRMRLAGIDKEDFHLYLWILNYDIHPEKVRDSLLDPIAGRIEMLEAEAGELQQNCDRSNNLIEDIITEGVLEITSNMIESPIGIMSMPPEILEALCNIFLNPEYDLGDFAFAESFEALKDWEEKANRFELDVFESEDVELKTSSNHAQTIFDFLDNADFIKQHFSLHQIEKAVQECSHEVLAEVQKDMQIIAKFIMIFARIARKIMPHTQSPADVFYSTDQFLPVLFSFGELAVLADISLRQNGYSEMINGARGKVLDKIEKEFSETVRKELEQSAPVIGQALTQTFEIVERRLAQLATISLEP
jgi:hypothetical protein